MFQSNRIPAPQNVEATFTANVPVALGITLWELEWMWANYCTDDHKRLAFVTNGEKQFIQTRPREEGVK